MPGAAAGSAPARAGEDGATARSRADRLERLVAGVEAREPRALGRAITLVESGGPGAEALVRRLQPRTGRARLVGVTGPPGAGKSTLVEALARHEREAGHTVAVLAVDPTSPFTGGALLGDRVRMQRLYTDPGVFIRSMATRGALGGLASAAHDAVDVLDAAGHDLVLVETVGVGQDEVDVVRAVDTVAVVVVPGMGDDVQAAKAGLLEIADVFVVNKADRDGADETCRALESMLAAAAEAGSAGEGWRPPVVRAVATGDDGVPELAQALAGHRRHLESTGALARRRRERLALRVESALRARVLAAAGASEELAAALDRGVRDGVDPYRIADRLFDTLGKAPETTDR